MLFGAIIFRLAGYLIEMCADTYFALNGLYPIFTKIVGKIVKLINIFF